MLICIGFRLGESATRSYMEETACNMHCNEKTSVKHFCVNYVKAIEFDYLLQCRSLFSFVGI